MTRHSSRQRGIALIIVLMVVAFVAILGYRNGPTIAITNPAYRKYQRQ